MYIPDAIPFLDLVTPHAELKDELTAVFLQALSTGAFVGGAMVEEFERAFAEFCDSRYAITASSGTIGSAPASKNCAMNTVAACPATSAQRRRTSHWMLTQLRSGIADGRATTTASRQVAASRGAGAAGWRGSGSAAPTGDT